MEMIVFCGIQGSGKSTFYKQKFFNSHLRISMDLFHTRNKENLFIKTCLEIQQRMVIDNTNPTQEERKKYIEFAKSKKFKVIGYFFEADLAECLERNNQRHGKEKIIERGIKATYKKLEPLDFQEGFDEIYHVYTKPDNEFIVKNMKL
jgi:predicted kinase